MHSKILITLLLATLATATHALSLSIPKAIIDNGVAAKFPKEKFSLKLDNPTTRFIKEAQKIELCGKWSTKLPQKTGDFCINFRPQWRKATGDIELSQVNILKISLGDDKLLPAAIAATLNSSLLMLLDGTSVYHVPDFVGKHVERIEVQESSFSLVF
jgi:hypothetical protein